jgi:hypothetical protein
VTTAGAWTNPKISSSFGRVDDSVGPPWFLSAALDFTIPTAGKVSKREAVASQEVVLARLAAAQAAWRIYAEVRDALLEASVSARELDSRSARRRCARRWRRRRPRASPPAPPRAPRSSSRGSRRTARAPASRWRPGRRPRRARARRRLRLPVAELEAATLAAPAPALEAGSTANDALLDRLDVRVVVAEYEVAERTLELELARQYPDVVLTPSWENDQGAHKLLLGFSVDVPIFDRNQGPIAEALAHRDAVAARFRERAGAALAAIDVAHAELACRRDAGLRLRPAVAGAHRGAPRRRRARRRGRRERPRVGDAARARDGHLRNGPPRVGARAAGLPAPPRGRAAAAARPERRAPRTRTRGCRRERSPRMTRRLPRTAALALLALAACRRDADEAHEHGAAAEEKAPFSVEREADGSTVVVLAPEALAAAGIASAVPVERTAVREIAAYGVLAADPAQVGIVRAPVAGVLADAEPKAWPSVGTHVEAGARVGTLLPRTTPLTTAELADLRVKLASAHADVTAAQVELDADRVALERARKAERPGQGRLRPGGRERRGRALGRRGARRGDPLGHRGARARAPARRGAEPPAAGTDRASHGGVDRRHRATGREPRSGPGDRAHDELRAAPRRRAAARRRAPRPERRIRPDEGARHRERRRRRRELRRDARRPRARRRPARGDAAAARRRCEGPAAAGHGGDRVPRRDAAPLAVFAVPPSALLRTASRDWVYVEVGAGRFARRAVAIVRAEGDAVLLSAGVDAKAKVVTSGAMALLSQEQLAAGGGSGE